jgi:hypothetical protein
LFRSGPACQPWPERLQVTRLLSLAVKGTSGCRGAVAGMLGRHPLVFSNPLFIRCRFP